jgi:hypothetical protein
MPQGLTLQERDEILTRLGPVFGESAAEALVGVLDRVVAWRTEMVTRQDFQQLQGLMAQLLEGQQALQETVAHLAEAQARTEERVGRLEETVAHLAEGQHALQEGQHALQEGQHALQEGQRVLQEGQRALQESVVRLTEAQIRAETELQQVRRQVGGLSDWMGSDLEDAAYGVVYSVLVRDLGWAVERLERVWQQWDGEAEEVNIFGQARDPARPDHTIWIIGEAKHNLTLREVERFAQQVERARQHLTGEIFPVCFCSRARPDVQDRLRELGIRLVFSYGRMI